MSSRTEYFGCWGFRSSAAQDLRTEYSSFRQGVLAATARQGSEQHLLAALGYGSMSFRAEYVGCHEAVSVATARQASRKEYVGCHEAVHMAKAR